MHIRYTMKPSLFRLTNAMYRIYILPTQGYRIRLPRIYTSKIGRQQQKYVENKNINERTMSMEMHKQEHFFYTHNVQGTFWKEQHIQNINR